MARLPDDVRASVEAAVREGSKSVRTIATDHGISPSSVSTIAREAGLEPAARARTKSANEARVADMQARRLELADVLMDDTWAIRGRMFGKQYQVVVVPMKGGGASSEVVEVPASASDYRNYMIAIGTAIDKVGVLTKVDQGTGEAAGLVAELVASIRSRRRQRADES